MPVYSSIGTDDTNKTTDDPVGLAGTGSLVGDRLHTIDQAGREGITFITDNRIVHIPHLSGTLAHNQFPITGDGEISTQFIDVVAIVVLIAGLRAAGKDITVWTSCRVKRQTVYGNIQETAIQGQWGTSLQFRLFLQDFPEIELFLLVDLRSLACSPNGVIHEREFLFHPAIIRNHERVQLIQFSYFDLNLI